jgi:SNF2 family DNA or RNA helicase
MEEGVQVLGVQIQAGGLGVDLTRARYCVFLSLGFNLTEYEQALARVHRPGQLRPVHYYHLLANGTVDRAVYGALRKKQDVIQEVLEGLKR